MSEISVSIEGLCKEYRIYSNPHQRIFDLLTKRKPQKIHHALNNIDLEIKKGEFFGIVGKNGAGKSTLLRILNEEIFPTSGRFNVDGDITLLQLGVGFRSELTGIENINLSCRLMGFSPDKITAIRQSAIEFAELEKFINYPIKTYSSGMLSRLSFAVGININPDVLIVDEVLSVGDIRFAQKCLRKIVDFKESGKTAIIVTHSLGAVEKFCDRAMWLHDGQIQSLGAARQVTEEFRNFMHYNIKPVSENSKAESETAPKKIEEKIPGVSEKKRISAKSTATDIATSLAEITELTLLNNGVETSVFSPGNRAEVHIRFTAFSAIAQPEIGWTLSDKFTATAVHLNTNITAGEIPAVGPGNERTVQFSFEFPNLHSGEYILAVSLRDRAGDVDMLHRLADAALVTVSPADHVVEQYGYCQIINPVSKVI